MNSFHKEDLEELQKSNRKSSFKSNLDLEPILSQIKHSESNLNINQ